MFLEMDCTGPHVTRLQRAIWYPSHIGPFAKRKALNHYCAAAILDLLCGRSPPAVRFAVSAAVVDTVKCFSRRPLPHIGKEIFELQPA
jgi:hypothetical protein